MSSETKTTEINDIQPVVTLETVEKTKSNAITETKEHMNHKKRKLDVYDADINDNEPDRKKIKLNENNTNNNTNSLIETNASLQKANSELKKENTKLIKEAEQNKEIIDNCKKECDKWKSKYMTLYLKLCLLTNNNATPLNNNTPTIPLDGNNFDDYSTTHNGNKSTNNCFANGLTIPLKPTLNNIAMLSNKPIMPQNNNDTAVNSIKTEYPRDKLMHRTDEMTRKNTRIKHDQINKKYHEIRARLLEMGFDKSEVINGILVYNNSDATPEFVFDHLINTFTPDITDSSRKLRSRRRNNKRNNLDDSDVSSDYIPPDHVIDGIDIKSLNNNGIEFMEFEDSFYVSINCHICDTHFDDIYIYRNHLKEHYNTDVNRVWRECDFDCKIKSLSDMHFIRHLATHTKDGPYKCNVIINGIKCTKTKGYRADMKQHWKSHFKAIILTKTQQTETINNTYEIFNPKEKQLKINGTNNNKKRKKNKLNIQKDLLANCSQFIEFENSYYISVKCHICEQHFDAIANYRVHLQTHYLNDPIREWKKCDLGCDMELYDSTKFIGHISTHTKDKPFRCNIIVNGIKCNYSNGYKSELKKHWKYHFPDANHDTKTKTKPKPKPKPKNKKKK
eukprot:197436_1